VTQCQTRGIRPCPRRATERIASRWFCEVCAGHVRAYLDSDHYEDDREASEHAYSEHIRAMEMERREV